MEMIPAIMRIKRGGIRGMKAGKGSQGVAALCMLVLGGVVAYGSGPVYNGIKSAGQGTAVDISGKNAEAYQVEGVWQRSDNGYTVRASAQGFQSQIQMEVLFDESGEQIQQVKVLEQGDTEGIGSKITEDSFAAGFAGVQAPVQVKDMEVVSPVSSGQIVEAEIEVEDMEESSGISNPRAWNAKNKSPEAEAVRALYTAGMLESYLNEEPLTTTLADLPAENLAEVRMEQAGLLEVSAKETDGSQGISNPGKWNIGDVSPEAESVRALYRAGMLDSYLNGQPLTTMVVDMQAEEQSIARMKQAGLLEKPVSEVKETSVLAAAISGTNVDGVSGATISSKGAATAVNNAYFFLKEEMGK